MTRVQVKRAGRPRPSLTVETRTPSGRVLPF